ncbi:DUF1999 domain-containing protein [Deinococcus cavernae]|uniref:DUF1999 domain-containing protein n=1 Tax=Deinococcus cavernae TaxID=2320857 RepID=A0A418VAM8_9DEIO|nr:DUF1999 domain-containing protein [Deinococcus cavernae]RJF73175.1 DUF1999 domain-containing protein [Deinococcus cavernae]
MEFRFFGEPDYAALQALDGLVQRAQEPGFEALPEREREGRLSTSPASLKFYERSEHSFVADAGAGLQGFILAQSVWQGDRPIVLVRTVVVHPDAPESVRQGLLHATVKSAYDTAVYEVHVPASEQLLPAAQQEEAHLQGQYAVIHLGTRAGSAPGVKLSKSVRAPDA